VSVAVKSRKKPITFSIKHMPLKRLFDIFFSLLALTLGAPIFLIIALAVKLSSPGKVVYSHTRLGRGGKPFNCLKFRTMYHDADSKLKKLLADSPSLREEWGRTQKLKNDPRITPIGHFLRKTSLDELPQFFNVLKGDISVVGPRAMVSSEVEKFVGGKARTILSVRPGITGLWQISGRSDTSYKQRIYLDEQYISNRSFFYDLFLIIKTIPVMLFSKGAY